MNKIHSCHMLKKNIWDTSDDKICLGSFNYFKDGKN